MHDTVRTSLVGTAESALRRRNDSINALYENHWAELCRYVRKQFGAGPPDPEDVAQQTFIKYVALRERESIDNPRAYLYRTAHNVVIDERRRLQVRAVAARRMTTEALSDVCTPERVLIGKERLDVLSVALRAMPAVRSRSFLLNRLHGLSGAAIARLTGYSESAVKKHIDLALIDLEAALSAAEQGIDG